MGGESNVELEAAKMARIAWGVVAAGLVLVSCSTVFLAVLFVCLLNVVLRAVFL